MRLGSFALLIAAFCCSLPAAARDRAIDVRAGSVADSAIALARQTNSSIIVADPEVAKRQIPRLRGRLSERDAVHRLAKAARARAVAVGASAWRLEALPHRVASKKPREEKRPRKTAAIPERQTVPPKPTEIIVISSKRETRFLDFPAQVSVLDGEELTLGGVGGTEKIVQRVATVSSTYLGSGRNKLFIRGIADSSFTGPTQATVGQYLGDLRLSYNAPDPDLRLSDLERVEVLEGPQGTLYGAGSLGGIIRIIPNAPVIDRTAYHGSIGGAVTQHGAGSADMSATANIPVVDGSAALRLTIDAASEGGYIDKPLLGLANVNRTNILAGRAMARVELASNWAIDALVLAQSTRANDSQYAARNGSDHDSLARVREGSDADYLQGQLVVAGQFDAIRLRSTTGIARQDVEERYDASTSKNDGRIFVQHNDNWMVAHETRLWLPHEDRPLGWIAGFSIIDNQTQLNRSLDNTAFRTTATGVLNTITEATIYGEASYRLRPRLIISFGGRYTHARLGGGAEDVPLQLMAEGAAITASRNQSAFLPSASLVAKLGPVTSFYARYQEGFRPGGLAIEGQFVRRFREDNTATLEVGGRHGRPSLDPFDVSLNVSYTRWSDIQADFIDELGLPSTANIGHGRVWTITAAGGVFIADKLRLTAGATFNRSQIDEPAILKLERIAYVPNIAKISGRLGLDFSSAISRDLDLDARAWGSYIGKSRLGIGPELGALQGDYLDSGLSVRIGNRAIGGSLAVTNIADAKGNRFALGTPFAVVREQITPLRPRTIRLGVDLVF